jgi:hypothetical protein
MDILPPYEISVYNRAAQRQIGTYYSNQVPREGEHLSFYGDRFPGDPFELWGHWKIDQVVWTVSMAGSRNALDLMRTHHSSGQAVCLAVELHVWPAEGPYFSDTPKWAKAATEPGHHDTEETP